MRVSIGPTFYYYCSEDEATQVEDRNGNPPGERGQGARQRTLFPCHSYLSFNVNVHTGRIGLSFRHSLDHDDAYVNKRLSKENRDEVESRVKAGAQPQQLS
jgi:hypothetical protein